MSFESALQRMGELNSLTTQASSGRPMSSATTVQASAASQQQFAQMLAMQMQQDQQLPGQPSIGLPGAPANSMASGLPMYGLPTGGFGPAGSSAYPAGAYPGMGYPGMMPVGGVQAPWQVMGDVGGGIGQKIVALAQGEVGVSESPPGSNNSPRIRDYRKATAGAVNTPGPWCAYFVSWLCQQAGAPIGAGGNGTGYVPTLESWGKSTHRWAEGGTRPRPGDIVIFDWGGAGTADHTGIVERVDADGTIHTIEGNSSNKVSRRTYAQNSVDIRGYVRAA